MAARICAAQAPAGEPAPVAGAAMQFAVLSPPQKQLVRVLVPSPQLLSVMHCCTAKHLVRSAPAKLRQPSLSATQAPFCSQATQASDAMLWQVSEQVCEGP